MGMNFCPIVFFQIARPFAYEYYFHGLRFYQINIFSKILIYQSKQPSTYT